MTWNLPRVWLDCCATLQVHENCSNYRPRSPRRLPTRLIDLENKPDVVQPRVRDSEGLPIGAKYMTLSHYWGRLKFLTLKRDNVDELKQRILVSDLKRTFKEAMEVTKRMSIQYLWIDSLCIIQDSVEGQDWRRESALMGQVCEHSHCHIAASKQLMVMTAASPIWREAHFMLEHVELRRGGTALPAAKYYLKHSIPWDKMYSDSPLRKRGWVVQELVLTPRALYFKQDQVIWECLEGRGSETFPFQRQGEPKLSLDRSSVMRQNLMLGRRANSLETADYAIWRDIVELYTQCALTYPEKDKLVAISGIANLIFPGDKYLCGLWEKYLPQQML